MQFSALKSVSLNGAVCNLRVLGALEGLNSIQIRYCPDLSGPPSSWSKLDYLSRGMSGGTRARRLKRSLELTKTREFRYAAIAQLRKKAWFESEFNVPFTNWEGKNGKAAMRTYKTALKAIKKASCEREARAVIEEARRRDK